MSEFAELACCNKKIEVAELWELADFKGYTKRKLLIGKCQICGDEAALQIMTSTDTGKTYYNLYNGIEAVKVIYREKRRKLKILPNIKTNTLYGWIYGVNVQIKNKKGEITQLRQYSSDFKNNKKIVKTILLKNKGL